MVKPVAFVVTLIVVICARYSTISAQELAPSNNDINKAQFESTCAAIAESTVLKRLKILITNIEASSESQNNIAESDYFSSLTTAKYINSSALSPSRFTASAVPLEDARCLVANGLPEKALTIISRLKDDLDINESPYVSYVDALAEEKLGHYEEAQKAMKSAVALIFPSKYFPDLTNDANRISAELRQSRQPVIAKESLLPPTARCTEVVVRENYDTSNITRGSVGDDNALAESVKYPLGQFKVAKCLQGTGNFVEALQILSSLAKSGLDDRQNMPRFEILDRLAVIEERLGLHKAAINHIKKAFAEDGLASIGHSEAFNPNDVTQPTLYGKIYKDYLRINAQSVAATRREVKEHNYISWQIMSPDERQVVSAHGGSESNTYGHPCHIETYDAGSTHEEVWWYGNDCSGNYNRDSGNYTTAYRFVNGQLQSTYNP